ncbi:MAG: DNA repair protein RecN [Acidobacteria bacterium]|nr:DNA repair protein RecN [Acidobacteriota bacterium]
MLRFIQIENMALVDSLRIEFDQGLNILSGETGSGKSIIIDSLGILLGDRATSDMIRSGSDKAFVEGIFEIGENRPLVDLLAEAGIETDGGDLIIRRELGSSARGRTFVNNRAANVALLREIQPHLIDLHGQGDQQSLLSAETHLNLLDAFAGTMQNRLKTNAAYDQILKTIRDLEESNRSESERLQALDMLDFQIAEIEQAGLRVNEDADLIAERNLLVNAERIANLSVESYAHLYEDDLSILVRLGATQKRLGDLSEIDSKFTPQLDQLLNIKPLLEDIAAFLRDYIDEIQVSPERLKAVEDRIIELDAIKRKYGKTIEDVLSNLERLIEKRESLLRSEENAQTLTRNLTSIFKEFRSEAERLSELRRTAAKKFEKAIARELQDVALGAGRFSINFSLPQQNQIAEKMLQLAGIQTEPMRRSGLESVEFYFSANPGEELKPISSVASGGELSRLMLVLKTITAPSLFPRSLIFDEIDAGIGGKVSDAVGSRLKKLSETNQVLCVTHQSQIARYADAHFQVFKEVVAGRTITRVVPLDTEGRVEELARMIGGAEITPLARKHAKEMLRSM